MQKHRYIYSFKYDYHHSELCKLESRQLFGKEEKDKLLFCDKEVEPSISPFIKNRIEIVSSASDYDRLLMDVWDKHIQTPGFRTEYINLEGEKVEFSERRRIETDFGYCVDAAPDFKNPMITYGICFIRGVWYFGILTKHSIEWLKHNDKPCSFSNSIEMITGKALVSIASLGIREQKLLDGCCGVGTVLLEACISKFSIEGCDINDSSYSHTLENLKFYGYEAKVHHCDIKDLDGRYDSVIIDLPYNHYAYADDEIVWNIIESAARLGNRVVIVSIADISQMILQAKLKVVDHCLVDKAGKRKFTRRIWVCESLSNDE
ncbi:TRM11 family SAM-dependent methyltransferase [Reichenbachiella versicolor]|uniref:TRM11 family SAM-dependent methyltransferase n=1 Tax=Reichenbachiella versicolor TaxID=1821036 RepID=UPI000D6E278F|nr:methyltransferase [Reichenbachiella versicolor]